jgi:hypothetical protein
MIQKIETKYLRLFAESIMYDALELGDIETPTG